MNESQMKDIGEMNSNTIERIISNKTLTLLNEDQLLHFINELFSMNKELAFLYEYVIFTNISCKMMSEFISVFESSKMTNGTWKSISKRLVEEIKTKQCNNNDRYRHYEEEKSNCFADIQFSNSELKGIFNYFITNSNIKEEVKVTYSSKHGGNDGQLLDICNQNNYFYTHNESNSWICFEFKKHHVSLSHYSIRSNNNESNSLHLKNWVIEGSLEGNNWIKIDEQNNNSSLNGRFLVHTFAINNENSNNNIPKQEFKYIRIRQTGPNWSNSNFLEICSVEFYGKIY